MLPRHLLQDLQEQQVRKKIFILYTGGTLGMKPMEDGALAPCSGYLQEVMNGMEELNHPSMPLYHMESLPVLLDSSDIGPSEWVALATIIEEKYLDYDGFLILCGTDTMAYIASALSFMMENLGKPVIFTGSMVPFCQPSNDARRNLIVSLLFASVEDLCEVCIFFNDKLLRANRTKKVATHDLDSFQSPNFPPLGRLCSENGPSLILVSNDLFVPPPKGRFHVLKRIVSEILVVRLVPGYSDSGLTAVLNSNLKAIVLELYGTGNASSKGALLSTLSDAIANKGIIVVATSQCPKGRVQMETYAFGLKLKKIGVVSGHDMTTEAIVTKLSVLMGCGYSTTRVKKLLSTSVCGELDGVQRELFSKL